MFFPISISAISIERISKAVPESKPLAKTTLEIVSGFSITDLCEAAEPIEVTIPSPTRANTVSSPAPPTNCLMLARTVTRARVINCIPSFATAVTGGDSITFGLTESCTASNTSRPARSIAVAALKSNSMFALSALMSARTTLLMLPPAK